MKKIITVLTFLLISSVSQIEVQCQELSNILNSKNVNQSIIQEPLKIDNLIGNFGNEIKIIFSDIDGTIMCFDKNIKKPNVSKINIEAVNKLKKAKLPLVLTTGRAYVEARAVSDAIGNKNSYIITNQGAEIRDSKGKLIYEDTIKSSDAKEIIAYINSINKTQGLTAKVVIFNKGQLYTTETFELPYIWAKRKVIENFDTLGNYSPCEILIYEPNENGLNLIQKELKAKFPSYHIDLSTHCFCDITNDSANKGNAVKMLSKKLNIDLKNAAVIGDAENDISMVKEVKASGGLAIGIESGMKNLKKNAGFITSAVDKGGFAKAVDKILENNSTILQKK